MSSRRSRALGFALILPLLAVLSGCTTAVSLEAAPDANNPDCANVTVRLPDTVGTLDALETDAQATGAWGDPVAVILRCGVEVPGPSTQLCIEIPGTGISWLLDDTDAPNYRYTSYGRDPAVSVAVNTEIISAGVALDDLANAVSFTPLNGRECTGFADTVTGDDLDADLDLEPTPSLTP